MEEVVNDRIIRAPDLRWKFVLCKQTNVSNMTFMVYDGPNWFHRLMQRLILGIIWTRL